MDYQKYFLDIIDFITPYKDILLREPLDNFEERSPNYPPCFRDQLKKVSDEEHYRFLNFHDGQKLGPELNKFQKKIELISEKIKYSHQETKELPSWALWKVSVKKQHEISQICRLISNEIRPKSILDIGGGVGHLARTLAHYYGYPTITIDNNQEFQEIGQLRAKKYPLPEDAEKLKFHLAPYKHSLSTKFSYDLSLGLHTCGPLAIEHLKAHKRPLINLGCCYHKLDTTTFPLSNFAKENLSFLLSKESFTLATRSHSGAELKQFFKNKKVKNFRFALQFLIEIDYGIKEFISVGSSVNSTYKSSFADYAIERLSHLKMTIKRTPDELNQFFESIEIQEKVKEIYLCNLIRWRFGRIVEILIILDRVLWLREMGVKAEIKALFDPTISPRNLAIIVLK